MFFVASVYAQDLQVLDVYDDYSGELTLNLSRLTEDISEYEVFIDGNSVGVFSGGQSSVTIPSPSHGEHLVEIIVTSKFTGAQGKVAFTLNFIPSEEEEEFLILPIPTVIRDAAGRLVSAVPGGDTTVDATSIITTTVVATSSTIAATSLFASGADLINYLIHVFISLLEVIGIKRRSKPWGTVYNALTKKPISFAKVRLLDEHSRVLESKIADKEGRYGFLVSAKSLTGEGMQIQLIAEKKGFRFPSGRVKPPTDTILYDNVYVGGIKTIQTSEAANFDLPLDPEQVEVKEALKAPARKLHNAFARLANVSFWFGLVTAPLGYLSDPNLFSFIVLLLFLVLAFFRVFGLRERPYGLILYQEGKKPMSFALITLNDKFGHRKGFTVSDESGRYFMVTEKGDYDLNVFTPADVQPQRSTKRELYTKKGWIAEEITL
jgi:hypothetical protein